MRKTKSVPKKDIDQFVEIYANAYPGFNVTTEAEKKDLVRRFIRASQDKRISIHGMYDGPRLLAALRFFDFKMNLFGDKVLVGGGGTLAVDLVHKKEHIARDLMLYFLRYYRKKNSPMAILWPFRPDFYKKMGAGIGTKINVYRVKPVAIPNRGDKKYLRFLGSDDMAMVNACYNRYVDRTTGMVEEPLMARQRAFAANPKIKYVGHVKGGRMLGYLSYTFEKAGSPNWLDNNLRVNQLMYESPEVLASLMTFLHIQFDQIPQVVIQTFDEELHHYLIDPRDDSNNLIPSVYHQSNVAGVGLMYRIIDTPRAFEVLKKRNYGGQTVKLKLTVEDKFLPENDGSWVIHFMDGKPEVKRSGGKFDVEMKLAVADFSSLFVGAATLRSLYNYGLVSLSDIGYLELLHRLFATDRKPICMTDF